MKVKRDGYKNLVPDEWKYRIEIGLCPVCGKPRSEWTERTNKNALTCSPKCGDEYNAKFVYWSNLQYEILKRDNFTCAECGRNQDKVDRQIEREKALAKGKRAEWLLQNVPESEIQKVRDGLRERGYEYLDEANQHFIAANDEEFVRKYAVSRWDEHKYSVHMRLDEDEEWKKKCPYQPENEIEKKKLILNVDHIKAIVNGGDQWDESNLQTLCEDCHKKKTKTDMVAYRRNSKGNQTIEESVG